MKIQIEGERLRVSEINELGASSSNAFRDQVREAMDDGHNFVEVDLSQTTFVDSCGIGALVALHKTASSRNGAVRLLNPQPPVRQILELTRMHRLLEIVKS